MLHPGAERVILFHVVADGECWVAVGGGQRHWAQRGDVVVLPYGNSHAMGGTAEAECVSIFSILNPPCHTRIARRIFRRYRLGYAVWASVNGRRVNASVPLRPRVIDFDQEEHAIRPQGVRLAEVFVRHSIDDRPGLVAVQDLDDVATHQGHRVRLIVLRH
jgi:hypothetical protein